MLRFLTDEDFDGRLTSALRTRLPDLDLIRVQDADLMGSPDEDVLEFAAMHSRIVLSHDRNTMTAFAIARISVAKPMLGLFIVDRRASRGQILDDLELLAAASEMDEWNGRIVFVPM